MSDYRNTFAITVEDLLESTVPAEHISTTKTDENGNYKDYYVIDDTTYYVKRNLYDLL